MDKKNNVVVLGSTGSIGTQTLEICERHGFTVKALAAGGNIELLEAQAKKFKPLICAVNDEVKARELKKRLAGNNIEVLAGTKGIIEAASLTEAGTVVVAVVGMAAIRPVLAAIDSGKRLALANKESLVCAGELVMARAKEKNAEIIPVDSEHSAVFQCLRAGDGNRMKKLILTASGGPFFGCKPIELKNITPEDALKHPNWDMGAKVTVDSATLMNKGLEFIEAMRLFSLSAEDIEVVVHRESVVHSAVEFEDGSVIAQMGNPDMRLPIQYALTYPERLPSPVKALSLTEYGLLSFYPPDEKTFRCLALAKQAARAGGLLCAALNAADETAVRLFIEGRLTFDGIAGAVEAGMSAVGNGAARDLDGIFAAGEIAAAAVKRFAAERG